MHQGDFQVITVVVIVKGLYFGCEHCPQHDSIHYVYY
jgi:hypothetical protein